MASPWDSKSVMASGDARPGRLPATTSPSSCTRSHVMIPCLTGSTRSPHSICACSLESATTRAARRTASTSSSARSRALEPAALMWAPGSSHAPWSTGVFELVIVTRMKALSRGPGNPLAALRVTAVHLDAPDPSHGTDGLQLGLGLIARAVAAHHVGVGAREVLCRDPTGGPGADLAEAI